MFAVIARTLLFIVVCFLSLLASFWTIRVAMADHLSLTDSLIDRRAAAALVPGDSRNWHRLARLEQQRGIPSLPSYERAIAVSPLNVEAWIDKGLEQEMSQDIPSAEASLVHAAEISREYVPRWSLLNFYFRRNDPAHFWPWARQALNLGYGDMQPVFRMAWGLSGDADRIQREMLPDRPLALAQYLIWLTAAWKLDAAAPIFSRLIGSAGEDEVPALEYYCNAQLAQGHVAAAKNAWAGILSRHLLPVQEDSASPTPGASLTNGRFTHDPLNTGFDWRKSTANGVFIRATFPGLRITLSGKQPESCELISQYVLLDKDRKYELSYEYETSGVAPESGLSWRVLDAKTGAEFTKSPKNLAREKMGSESIFFTAPPQVDGGRLVLSYQRTLGTTRITGWLQLKQVALQAAN